MKGAARAGRDYFTSVVTGLSLALMRMTSVFDSLSVAFRPKCWQRIAVFPTMRKKKRPVEAGRLVINR
jgi:hypothetical protein